MDKNANGTIIDVVDVVSDKPVELDNGNGDVENGDSKPIVGYEEFDPRTVGGGSGSGGTGKRRPGRPRKDGGATGGTINSSPKVQQPRGAKNLEGIETLLLSVHLMGATILSTPELVLDPDEAKKLSTAIQNVAAFYPLGMSPKQVAWANLVIVAGGIYGTRLIAIRNRVEHDKASRPKAVPKPPPQPINTPRPPTPAQATSGTGDKGRPLNPSEIYGSDNAGVNDTDNGMI